MGSDPAFVTQLVGQVDVGEEVGSNGRQRLYLGFDSSLLNQFHLPQEDMFTLWVLFIIRIFIKVKRSQSWLAFSLTSLLHSG